MARINLEPYDLRYFRMRFITWEAECAPNASSLILARAIAHFERPYAVAADLGRLGPWVHGRILASFSIFQTWIVGAVIHHSRCRWSVMSFFNMYLFHDFEWNVPQTWILSMINPHITPISSPEVMDGGGFRVQSSFPKETAEVPAGWWTSPVTLRWWLT